MKKLMIAAAIVCAAAISHGASLQWGMTGIPQTDKSSLVNGAVAYFMAADTLTDFAGAVDKAAYCADNYTYTGSATIGRANIVNVVSGSYNEGDPISGYVVLFDTADAAKATYYCNTGVLSTEAPGAGNAILQPTFAVGTALTGGSAGWQPVPEPTSGLLLLIGVAGLALKRRRA